MFTSDAFPRTIRRLGAAAACPYLGADYALPADVRGTAAEGAAWLGCELLASTGGPSAAGGLGGLSVVDFSTLRHSAGGVPILYGHHRAAPAVVGRVRACDVVERSRYAPHGLRAEGVTLNSAVTRELAALQYEGKRWRASIATRSAAGDAEYIQAGRDVLVNGAMQRGPFHLIRNATLYEISGVAEATDPGAWFRFVFPPGFDAAELYRGPGLAAAPTGAVPGIPAVVDAAMAALSGRDSVSVGVAVPNKYEAGPDGRPKSWPTVIRTRASGFQAGG